MRTFPLESASSAVPAYTPDGRCLAGVSHGKDSTPLAFLLQADLLFVSLGDNTYDFDFGKRDGRGAAVLTDMLTFLSLVL
jgi:hypothetical protein